MSTLSAKIFIFVMMSLIFLLVAIKSVPKKHINTIITIHEPGKPKKVYEVVGDTNSLVIEHGELISTKPETTIVKD